MKKGEAKSRRGSKKRSEPEGYVEPLLELGPDGQPTGATHPPYHLPSEQAVLGAMLTERQAIVRVAGFLSAADFYSPQHQVIAETIFALFHAGEPVDLVTVLGSLGTDRTEQVGGASYLIALQEAAPTAAAIRTYARRVRRDSAYRQQLFRWDSYLVRPDEEHRTALVEALELSVADNILWITGDDLVKEKIEVEWLIEPLIPLGGVTLLAGDSDMGKSWLALSLCHALANRFDTWLCSDHLKIRCKGATALYVDMEVGEAGMRDRLMALDEGHGTSTPIANGNGQPDGELDWEDEEDLPGEEGAKEESPPRPLYFAFFPQLELGPAIGGLEADIRSLGARLLVLDCMAEMIPGWANPNDAAHANKLLRPLKRLAVKCNIAIILVTHLKKPQQWGDNSPGMRVMHSQRFLAAPDSGIALVGRPDGDKSVAHLKARLSKRRMRAFRLGWHTNPEGRGLLLCDDGPMEEPGDEKIAEAMDVIEEMLRGGPHKRQVLIDALVEGGISSKRTAGEALSRLSKDGKVTSRRIGREAEYHAA